MRNCRSIIKLVILLVLVPIAIYVLSVSDTIDLNKEYLQVKKSTEIVHATDCFDGVHASVPLLSSGTLMSMLSDECAENKVSVVRFSPEKIGGESMLHLVSAQLNITGDFIGLLKVLACLENIQDIKISGAKFSVVKVEKNSKLVLLELALLQMEEHRL